jgi:hypothetical protein
VVGNRAAEQSETASTAQTGIRARSNKGSITGL